MNYRTALILALAVPLAAACGGVSNETQANTLSAEETADLCLELEADLDSVQPTRMQECTVGAIFASSDQASCEATRDACLEMEPMPREDPFTCGSTAGCRDTVVVGDFRACIGGLVDATNTLYAFDCSVAGTENAPTIADFQSAIAVCQTLGEDCGGS